MPILLQISIEANVCSIGKIEQQIGDLAIEKGWSSYMTFSRGFMPGSSTAIRVGNMADVYWHVLMTRLFDRHGLHSKQATKRLINKIVEISPDIIHLHQIHGYYLNIKLLFDFLRDYGRPVVWTFHDCWAFTGHCAHFVSADCEKWKTQCDECPLISKYPKSFVDRSSINYSFKKDIFTSLSNIHIVTVSKWLESLTRQSFFKYYDIQTIYNGINTELFKYTQCYELKKNIGLEGKNVLVAAATTWNESKGLRDYIKLASLLPEEVYIILVGLKGMRDINLPKNIIALPKTDSSKELAEYYSMADIVLNLSYAETFGLTTVEGLACGKPVIVYKTTASPELITPDTGFVVDLGDIEGVATAVKTILKKGESYYSKKCRERAVKCFDMKSQYAKYIYLYEQLLH